ncbi:MAG TPA: hypothetical protein DEF35_22605 [Paenibacillus sp.]|nr:hypothetical protein CA599_16225 [Paenibacillus taichungensis]HBU84408.1 hypothetical protein [Paenibacillus sp.]
MAPKGALVARGISGNWIQVTHPHHLSAVALSREPASHMVPSSFKVVGRREYNNVIRNYNYKKSRCEFVKVKLIFVSTAMIFFLLLIGCSEKQIAIDQIIGEWKVTSEQVNLEKFTSTHGMIRIYEGLRIAEHFEEDNVITILGDGSIEFPTITGGYELDYQDGYNYISIIGDSSESVHPVYVNDDTLQINTYILKRIK